MSADGVLKGSANRQTITPAAAEGGKRKTVTGKDASRNQATTIKLPKCPEGQSMTPSGTPCERSIFGRKGVRRKPGFRLPLKKEDGNMEAQIVEYNAEFPNRVVVRLEYLMQSTKVRLNDRHYMDDFYEKLLEEERIAMNKAMRQRERLEQNRMKKLIIDGLNKDIPPELSYLNKHPVFRVNQMLGRLKQYDLNLGLQAVGADEEITAVEPYEYNGNQFFKHLHETGDLWAPSEQRLFDEEKLDGKIYRAKLRLLQKRKEKAAEENILRILNNVEQERLKQMEQEEEEQLAGGEEGDYRPPPQKSKKEAETPSWMSDFESQVDIQEDDQLNQALKMKTVTRPFSAVERLVDQIKADAQKQVGRLGEKIRRSKEEEKQHEALLDLQRQEQECHFLDTFNYDKARIISNYDKRQKRGQVDDLLNRPEQKPKIAKKPGEITRPYERLFQPDFDEKTARTSTKFGNDPLFLKLRKAYGLGKAYPFHHHEEYDNELILRYFDKATDGKEMMEFGGNVANMYTREMLVADDHLKERMRAMQQKKKESLDKESLNKENLQLEEDDDDDEEE